VQLDQHINWCIFNYPTLYRSDSYELSRIKVLGHIFLTIGNGYEWNEKGYLSTGNDHTLEALPENYFQQNLYELDTDQPIEAIAALEGRIYYLLDRYVRLGESRIVFEAKDEEDAKPFFSKYGKRIVRDFVFVMESRCKFKFNPYPICDYSTISEMLAGRTNSPHIENFDLINIQPDWIQGAVDVVRSAAAYYNNPEQYKSHTYYGYYCREGVATYDPKKWETFHKSQIEILERFLEKFA
jgi:hypothetical protein